VNSSASMWREAMGEGGVMIRCDDECTVQLRQNKRGCGKVDTDRCKRPAAACSGALLRRATVLMPRAARSKMSAL
jgi:hypothetical protein